ncbi:MAG: hypothetical protein ACK57H_05635, partial [Hyphomonadaceae bacterium]
ALLSANPKSEQSTSIHLGGKGMIWGLYVRGGGYQTTCGGLVTHSWAYRLIEPGRMVSVVFRASPLIWPTSFGANPAPRYLFCCTPGGFPRGAIGAG